MKYIIIFLLFLPFALHSQIYRLDSIRRISPSEISLSRFVYEDDRNFLRYGSSSQNSSNGILNYSSISYFVDSLEVKEVHYQHGDSVEYLYTYDHLRRLTADSVIRHDTLLQTTHFAYHEDTNLLLSEERVNFRNGDTSHYYLETSTYDSMLRVTSFSYYIERADTFYRAAKSRTSFLGDTASYSLSLYQKPNETPDTFYGYSVYLPDHYFGDTLRQWTKFYDVTKDTAVLSADERVSFTWGDYNKYEDAGDWTYLHGIIYGGNIDYEPTSFGYSFVAYESIWQDANPEDWQTDIVTKRDEIYTGNLRVNQVGLPIERWIKYDNDVVSRTYWYYSIITTTQEPIPNRPPVTECMIIRQFNPGSRYYDMSGVEVTFPVGTQLLLEANKECIKRVLFVSDRP